MDRTKADQTGLNHTEPDWRVSRLGLTLDLHLNLHFNLNLDLELELELELDWELVLDSKFIST